MKVGAQGDAENPFVNDLLTFDLSVFFLNP